MRRTMRRMMSAQPRPRIAAGTPPSRASLPRPSRAPLKANQPKRAVMRRPGITIRRSRNMGRAYHAEGLPLTVAGLPPRRPERRLEATSAPDARPAVLRAILASDASGPAGDILRALDAQVADAAPRRANRIVARSRRGKRARPARAGRVGSALAAAGRGVAALALHAAGTAGPCVKTVGANVVA
jgi:hypothetical protein